MDPDPQFQRAEVGYGETKITEKKLKQEREAAYEIEHQRIFLAADPTLQKSMQLAKEKGASALITTLPLERHGFVFPCKRDFRDLMCLRYHHTVPDLPPSCSCGEPFSIDHSQVCRNGGFIHQRHNEAQQLFAYECQQAAFRDTELEPPLISVDDEKIESKQAKITEGALSDVRVRGYWGNQQNAFFEFRVFYPLAKSYASLKPAECYTRFEKSRSAQYEEQINKVDCGSFTPMIMSSTGGMGPRMTMAMKRLAEVQAEKTNQLYSTTIAQLRCRSM